MKNSTIQNKYCFWACVHVHKKKDLINYLYKILFWFATDDGGKWFDGIEWGHQSELDC